jgi:hypothetical protein
VLKSLLLGVLALPLIGCSTAPFPPQEPDANLGKVVLSKQLTIASDSARAFVQAGQVVTQADSRDPVCVFESWQVSKQTQSIIPDVFKLADITRRRGDVSGGFGVYGSTDMGMGVTFGLGGFGSPVYPSGSGRFGDQPRLTQAATLIRLVSERQPLIYQLTCFSATGWTQFVEPPTVADMNMILGDVAQVELVTKEKE